MSKWKLCSVAGCKSLSQKRGLCWGHLDRLKRTGDIQADKPIRKPMVRLGKILDITNKKL
jgi:hypothetical protein